MILKKLLITFLTVSSVVVSAVLCEMIGLVENWYPLALFGAAFFAVYMATDVKVSYVPSTGAVERKQDIDMSQYVTKKHMEAYLEFSMNHVLADKENALDEISILQQKFDVLAETLGVVIAADLAGQPPEPVIEKIRENGLLGHAKDIVSASVDVAAMIKLQRRLMTEQIHILERLAGAKK